SSARRFRLILERGAACAVIATQPGGWPRSSAAARPGEFGNSDAIWPSSPMPSTTKSKGRGNSASVDQALPAAACGSASALFSPTNCASAAALRSKCCRTRCSLLALSCVSTQRSSVSVTQTLDQSSCALESRSNSGTGVCPPGTTKLAPRPAARPSCSRPTISAQSASANAAALAKRRSCVELRGESAMVLRECARRAPESIGRPQAFDIDRRCADSIKSATFSGLELLAVQLCRRRSARISDNYIPPDHERVSSSAGLSHDWRGTRASLDRIFGSGSRQSTPWLGVAGLLETLRRATGVIVATQHTPVTGCIACSARSTHNRLPRHGREAKASP